MVLKLVPGLRAMKGHRPVFASLILRPEAAGGADDTDAGVFS